MDYRETLQRALDELTRRRAEIDALRREKSEPIAVVGMACRFPGGADTPDAFWRLLDRGGHAITNVPGDRWNAEDFYDADPARSGKMTTRRGGFVHGVDQFEPQFFGISPREAQSMDPQQRLVLEVAWEALENANIAAADLYGTSTGVFIGVTCFDHAIRLCRSIDNFGVHAGTGSGLNVVAGRLSYVLGVTGPSMAIDTACSSSLVGLHLACQSLRARESDLVLAGGVHLILSPEVMVSFSQARMLSADGLSKTFDDSADGYSRGEGCGVVVLKRLSDAIGARDNILGVIRGTAVNQDGPSGGLTVPNGKSQEKVIRRALDAAVLPPSAVDYVETHGTGTPLGDPIEVEALSHAYGEGRDGAHPLWIGSVKTNIGHLEPAAGMAALIKVLLAFGHERIPAHLHFRKPNAHIPWASIPVKVTSDAMPWPRTARPRVAGLSAFGFSGTNAHLIIEEPPPPSVAEAVQAQNQNLNLLVLSAKSEPALRELAARYSAWFANHPNLSPASVCYTAATGRSHFSHRLAATGTSLSELRGALDAFVLEQDHPRLVHGRATTTDRRADREASIQELASSYIQGAQIDWGLHFGPEPPEKTPLPNTAFQRARYWLESRERVAVEAPAAPTDWYYGIDWVPCEAESGLTVPMSGRLWTIAPFDPIVAQHMSSAGLNVQQNALAPTDRLVLISESGWNSADLLDMVHRKSRVWIVTRSATSSSALRESGLSQAPVAGFAKCLSLEHPELYGRLMDLDHSVDPDKEAEWIVSEILRETLEDHVAYRNGRRLVPRLERLAMDSSPAAPVIHPDAAYLITGGFGAVGIQVARWLAGQGVRHLYLLGRHPKPVPGLEHVPIAADVTNEEQMRAVIHKLMENGPVLRGIVHAAGVPGFVELHDLTTAEFDAVLAPKVRGAQILHEVTLAAPLDFFVCFSSIASAWGSRGQAHYAAANAYLDSLAHYRRGLGLPSLTINWGPWLAGGMTSGEAMTLLRRVGVRPLPQSQAIAAMQQLLASGFTQAIAADIDWRLFRGSYEARGRRPLLEKLESRQASEDKHSSPLLQHLESTSAGLREGVLVDVIQREVAEVLELSTSPPDPDQGLFEMGMDSLMALELRTRLEAQVSHALPATLVFECPDIRSIARYLLNTVLAPPRRPESAPAGVLPLQAEARDLDSMSDEEAEALLLQKLERLASQ